MSASPADILSGLKQGHAFITFAPDGPTLEMTAGDAIIGDSVVFSRIKEIRINARNLLAGDIVRVVTALGNTPILSAETAGDFHGVYTMEGPGFARVEILRSFIPGIPKLPALISNPIYFDTE